VILAVFDEVAYFSATVGEPRQQKEFTALLRDLVACGRAAGVIVIAATNRPSADIFPTSRGTCSATGGHSAAPPKPRPTSSWGTAGPSEATAPPTLTRPPAGSAG
jgi:hypothetical protein